MANYRNESFRNDRYSSDRSDRQQRFGRSTGGRSVRNRNRYSRDQEQDSSRLIASDRVEGTPVYGRDGDRLGTIENFMVGKRSGRVEYAVMSFGGFVGIGERHYPLPWDELDYDESQGGYVVDMEEDDLDRAPNHRAGDRADFEGRYGSDVRAYYGY